MIVCICRGVSDREIRAVVSQGASSFAEVRAELGTGECCGKCSRQVRELIDEHAPARHSCSTGATCACA
ncbi:MAG: (2Fe-2S)-binding protein [Burkholderiaceae bacterium]|nr:(2Fe-2S)-binding protein [Burkholderiaceae bacterium]MCO5106472.1 (2Fe-2S)-binding protein [Burkholderiaceae bacterium]